MQDVAALHRLVDASEEEEASFLNSWIFLKYRLERSPRYHLLNINIGSSPAWTNQALFLLCAAFLAL